MTTQASLFDAGMKAPPKGNLFLALVPDAQAIAAIGPMTENLRAQHQLKAKAINPERLHVTLHFLGDYVELSDSLLASVRQAAETVVAAPFDLTFDLVKTFPVGRYAKPFVLTMSEKNADLIALHKQMREPLIAAGFKQWLTSSFTPHVTLLYDNTVVAPQPVPAIKWTVREFVLLYSVPRKGHTRLGTWKFAG